VILAHLSDLHLRTDDDVAAFGRQLGHIVRRSPAHTVITGDILDRWQPRLLACALDALQAHGLLDAERLTILHGNHDLASSGGHPRDRGDAWRLAVRFWDPPPLLASRRRAFYRMVTSRAHGVARTAPYVKEVASGLRFAILDSVPFPWIPLALGPRRIVLKHGEAAIAASQLEWLSRQSRAAPTILLMHHYPLPVAPFEWPLQRGLSARLQRVVANWTVAVPMELPAETRAQLWRAARGATAILCGHVHRARLESHEGIAVGLNGQSGAPWAGRTIAYYTVEGSSVSVEHVGSDGGQTGVRPPV
jgi:3',5'-cyclic AMP phosphodiesterase CpdA